MHKVTWDGTVANNMPLAVDVGEKEVQRLDTLNESPLDMLPLPGEYEAGDAIDGG